MSLKSPEKADPTKWTVPAEGKHHEIPCHEGKGDCATCSLRLLEMFMPSSAVRNPVLQQAKKPSRKIPSGTTILFDGDLATEVYILYSGWAFSYKMLEDGRRQILSIYLPGDVIGLQAIVGEFMDHSVETLGEVQLCVFDGHKAVTACETDAIMQHEIFRMFDNERRHLQDILIGIGRRSSPENLAHLLLSIFTGLEQRDLTYGNACLLPLTQTILADALGLSPEHLNRLLKQLKDDGLVSLNRSKMVIHDRAGLSQLAQYEDHSPPTRPLL